MLLDCSIFANFIYCPLTWHLISAILSPKIEKVQERTLRLLYDDSFSRYNSSLSKAGWPIMEVSHLWKLATEVFKTIKILKSRLDVHLSQERFTFCLEKKWLSH